MMGEGQHGPGPLACACCWDGGPSPRGGSYISILSTEEQIAMLKKDTKQEKAQNGTNGRKTKTNAQKGYKKKRTPEKKAQHGKQRRTMEKQAQNQKEGARRKKKGAKQKKQAQNGKKRRKTENKAQNGKKGANQRVCKRL